MDAVYDIATPSFDFFPIISVIPLFESVSLFFLSSKATNVHCSLLFLPPYIGQIKASKCAIPD